MDFFNFVALSVGYAVLTVVAIVGLWILSGVVREVLQYFAGIKK